MMLFLPILSLLQTPPKITASIAGPVRILLSQRANANYTLTVNNRGDKPIAVLWRKFESGLEVSKDKKVWEKGSNWGENERAMRPRAEDFVIVGPHKSSKHVFALEKSRLSAGAKFVRGIVFWADKTSFDGGMDNLNWDRARLETRPFMISVGK